MNLTSRIESIRKQFPALQRTLGQQPVIYLDGPAGTQVPNQVADRVREAMLRHNANRHGQFATSHEVEELMADAHGKVAAMLGCDDPGEIAFGPNMTTLNFQLSRAISRTWNPGDEIVVTRLDHDANVTPWVMAAEDRGALVRHADILTNDATLDLESLAGQLNERTRLVAVTCASNAVGSKTDVARIVALARSYGALVSLDAVHYAPHGLIDVQAWNCDFLLCSAYKFYGPHVGILWGKRALLEQVRAYKVRPAPDSIPEKWMTGTQNHACIAGVSAAVEYMASLADANDHSSSSPLRQRWIESMREIELHESSLTKQMLAGLAAMDHVRLYGIASADRIGQRVPTFALTVDGWKSWDVAKRLGEQGIHAWHGNYYALPLSQRLGREPDGMLRLGLMHYNTPQEVDRVLDALTQLTERQPSCPATRPRSTGRVGNG